MEITFEQIGLIFQLLGVTIILVAQLHFLWKLWKKWKNFKIGFLDVISSRWMSGEKELKAMKGKELEELFKKFPLALWLRSNFIESISGLFLTFVGLLIELLAHGSIII